MTGIHFAGAIICHQPFYRLPLNDGTHVYMEWHSYFGPTFYRDRDCTRMIEEWYDDPRMVEACKWFTGRDNRA